MSFVHGLSVYNRPARRRQRAGCHRHSFALASGVHESREAGWLKNGPYIQYWPWSRERRCSSPGTVQALGIECAGLVCLWILLGLVDECHKVCKSRHPRNDCGFEAAADARPITRAFNQYLHTSFVFCNSYHRYYHKMVINQSYPFLACSCPSIYCFTFAFGRPGIDATYLQVECGDAPKSSHSSQASRRERARFCSERLLLTACSWSCRW